MSKDLINKILEEIGLESINAEADDTQAEGPSLDTRPDSKIYSNNW